MWQRLEEFQSFVGGLLEYDPSNLSRKVYPDGVEI